MSQNGIRRRPTKLDPRAGDGRERVLRFRARGESLRNGRGLCFRIIAPPSRVSLSALARYTMASAPGRSGLTIELCVASMGVMQHRNIASRSTRMELVNVVDGRQLALAPI